MDLLRRLLGARDDRGDLGPVVRYVPAPPPRAPVGPAAPARDARAADPRPADPRTETARHARPRPARPQEPDPSGELFVDDASSEDLVEEELVAALDEPAPLSTAAPVAPVAPVAPAAPAPEPDARQVATRRLRRGLEAGTRTLSVKALTRGGLERVRVIDGATIERLVTDALDVALRRRQARLSADERAALEADVRRDLVRLSAENARLVDRRAEFEARLAELGRERTALDI